MKKKMYEIELTLTERLAHARKLYDAEFGKGAFNGKPKEERLQITSEVCPEGTVHGKDIN